jgi:hypothetical protein
MLRGLCPRLKAAPHTVSDAAHFNPPVSPIAQSLTARLGVSALDGTRDVVVIGLVDGVARLELLADVRPNPGSRSVVDELSNISSRQAGKRTLRVRPRNEAPPLFVANAPDFAGLRQDSDRAP